MMAPPPAGGGADITGGRIVGGELSPVLSRQVNRTVTVRYKVQHSGQWRI